MARFQWFNGNHGLFAFGDFASYTRVSLTDTEIVYAFVTPPDSGAQGSHAAEIRLTLAGATSYVAEDGPNADGVVFTGGTIASVTYRDDAASVLMTVTGLQVNLPVFLATLARGDGFGAWRMISAEENFYLGADDATTESHAGTGDIIDTGHRNDTVLAALGDDFIIDRGGADSYGGGFGFDTLSYDAWFFTPWLVQQGLRADLLLGTITGPDGLADRLTGIDGVNGTFLTDVFLGNGGANSFAGFAGQDRFDGRGGFDMVRYAQDASQGGSDGIRVNLTERTVRDGFGQLDRLTSIEGVEGTDQRDSFIDNRFDNFFAGLDGADVLRFGLGSDTGRGGAGADVFVFRGTGFGSDTIEDFSHDDGDRIMVEAATSFAQFRLSTVVIAGALATFVETPFGTLTMLGVTAGTLTATDFGF